MSGTSRDGIDAALIRTDGEGEVDPVAFVSMPYDYSFRSRLAEACLKAMAMAQPGPDPLIDAVAGELTSAHAADVRTVIAQQQVAAGDVAVIGVHGHQERGWRAWRARESNK